MSWEPLPVGERQPYAFTAILILSVWLFISPFVIDYTHLHGSLWNALEVALLSAFIVGIRISGSDRPWPTWINALLGLWLIASPWIFGDSGHTNVLINNIVVGILLVVASLVAVTDTSYRRMEHEEG